MKVTKIFEAEIFFENKTCKEYVSNKIKSKGGTIVKKQIVRVCSVYMNEIEQFFEFRRENW